MNLTWDSPKSLNLIFCSSYSEIIIVNAILQVLQIKSKYKRGKYKKTTHNKILSARVL